MWRWENCEWIVTKLVIDQPNNNGLQFSCSVGFKLQYELQQTCFLEERGVTGKEEGCCSWERSNESAYIAFTKRKDLSGWVLFLLWLASS